MKKVLLKTWTNDFDYWTLFICTMTAVGQTAIFFSIMVCFSKSHQAGLNIGIAQAVWAISPFFVALMERFGYGVGLKVSQMLGVLAMIACAVCISLSELFKTKETSTVVEV